MNAMTAFVRLTHVYIVQCLWVVIDEIDKVGSRGHHGDPSAAFLEVLDPEQNSTFVSSLSRVFCFCQCNLLGKVMSID